MQSRFWLTLLLFVGLVVINLHMSATVSPEAPDLPIIIGALATLTSMVLNRVNPDT